MCGIVAICATELSAEPGAIKRMVAALEHRGPDAQAWRSLPGCHLGHARLSIIDLATGAQPMADAAGRFWITFNGEIYNYEELRNELVQAGRGFNTHSDTEVILAAYAEWGPACLDRFRGMFAFAIWDTQTRRLFAARDLFGEKPLYYAIAGSQLIIGSEIAALAASGALSPAVDRTGVDAYLALGYVPPHRTIYQNVQTLPPGHCLDWHNGAMRVSRYWAPRLTTQPVTLDQAAERLRALLRQAVRRQMVADVPVGAFLSGGHDSSTVVALMHDLTARPVKTFSVGFGDDINELPYARQVAQRYDTEHYELDLQTPPVAPLLERMADVYDEPFMDASHIPTFVVSQFARKQVKVVLTGDGADELFGGYAWYPLLAAAAEIPASLLVWIVLRSASKLVADRNRALALYSRAMGMAVRWPDPWTRYLSYRSVFSDDERAMLWRGGRERPHSEFPRSYYQSGDAAAGASGIFHFDLSCFLPGDILVKVDRAAMAHGLETRAPFLDRDVVEFALSLPASLKVDGHDTKRLFKHALARYWPEAIRRRSKQGFAAPFQKWLLRPDVQILVRRVFAPGSALRQLLPGVTHEMSQRRDHKTWSLLTLGLWLERRL